MNEAKKEMEARMFSTDIETLKEKVPEFKIAFDKKSGSLELKLKDLLKIVPRATPKVISYRRLQNYLKEIGIDLKIVSQKSQ